VKYKSRFNDEDVVVTGAGNYGDEEAILRWRREGNSKLWINDPVRPRLYLAHLLAVI
jgi:hypothetical protein